MTGFIVWNQDPELIRIGSFAVRYYGVLFASAFFFGYIILSRLLSKEGVPLELLDKLTVYMAVGTIIGARLGHCFFYEPEYFLKNPIEILKVWRGGLASHGAAIGIILALFLFVRKTGRGFFWTIDRVLVVTALGAFFIRCGNLMNSEIYGFPTGSNYGLVYARDITDQLKTIPQIDRVSYRKIKAVPETDSLAAVPLDMEIRFRRTARNETELQGILQYQVSSILHRAYFERERNVFLTPGSIPGFELRQNEGRYFVANARVEALPRHPTHIYEALAYMMIFLFLLGVYLYHKGLPKPGLITGLFLVILFSARFVIEFIKENQVEFEDKLRLNMGQWLSIPFIVLGAAILLYVYLNKEKTSQS